MSVTSIEHVLVLSDDIDRTRDFYRDVVGLEVGERPPLGFPGYWLYAGATACVHIAERVPYAAHAARLGLERRGVAAVTNTVPGGPRQVFIENPNGVRVEINVRS